MENMTNSINIEQAWDRFLRTPIIDFKRTEVIVGTFNQVNMNSTV